MQYLTADNLSQRVKLNESFANMRSVLQVAFAITLLESTSVVNAQISVQQPVVRSTSIGTTVSVPDRGSVFLGGVNSAAASRQSYGPLRTGDNRGLSLSSSSAAVSVRIIDLHAMDEAILNSVPDASPSVRLPVPRAEHRDALPPRDVSSLEKGLRFEELARQAEASGRTGVARLHWQMAARHGSTLARNRLAATP